MVAKIESAGVPKSKIVMLGFSQGACLTSEFAVRNAARFGGFVIFHRRHGRARRNRFNYPGQFGGTPNLHGLQRSRMRTCLKRVFAKRPRSSGEWARRGPADLSRDGPVVNDDEILAAQGILDRAADR
jgi:pimeloyl-ACP methyl ester carboxylesterase